MDTRHYQRDDSVSKRGRREGVCNPLVTMCTHRGFKSHRCLQYRKLLFRCFFAPPSSGGGGSNPTTFLRWYTLPSSFSALLASLAAHCRHEAGYLLFARSSQPFALA